ncbi:MAG TPA: hypothetical protein VMB71_15275 [Acetobacteraceae bacterium]|nr:hypothetical protein [Acetobacteraceae bacterium]
MTTTLQRIALISALGLLTVPPAKAAWLQCTANASDGSAQLGFYTTIVEVGAVPATRLRALNAALAAYARKYPPGLTVTLTRCATFQDESDAASHYSRLLATETRRLGWSNVIVVQPSDWLQPSDIKVDPALP